MTKKILITGGPVHAYLDAVKIITNRFKGGLMSKLAGEFVDMAENRSKAVKVNRGDKTADVHVTYLCSKSSQQPWWADYLGGEETPHLTCIHHDGIDDYMEKVVALAPTMDAIVLGAAVANLIPKNKIEGKFPSHDYKPGDTIPIEFTIAPRIIDEVKKVAPHSLLFGYKLLSGVGYYELISAAYGVLLESKAVTVFANDAMDLMQKYAVTKERGVHPMHNNDVAQWILDRLEEKYYYTIMAKNHKITDEMEENKEYLRKLLCSHKCNFVETEEGYVFGSGAIRYAGARRHFVTTARGKNELEEFAFVDNIDHSERKICCSTPVKASLNAPLFDSIFFTFPDVKQILHFHHQREDLVTVPYATPGTDKDSVREKPGPSFNIEGHGCILSYDKLGKLLK
jgi:hypothetical protein